MRRENYYLFEKNRTQARCVAQLSYVSPPSIELLFFAAGRRCSVEGGVVVLL